MAFNVPARGNGEMRWRHRADFRVAKRPVVIAGMGTLAGAGVFVATYPCWRPWCLSWGARAEEVVDGGLPGDDLLVDPDVITTRAVPVEAPPEAVWPWLVQMGPGRGGLYTYRLDREPSRAARAQR
jgi:hypothetical protein